MEINKNEIWLGTNEHITQIHRKTGIKQKININSESKPIFTPKVENIKILSASRGIASTSTSGIYLLSFNNPKKEFLYFTNHYFSAAESLVVYKKYLIAKVLPMSFLLCDYTTKKVLKKFKVEGPLSLIKHLKKNFFLIIGNKRLYLFDLVNLCELDIKSLKSYLGISAGSTLNFVSTS